MTTPTQFDLISSPLVGKTLIEASAGTGKTFTITRLFLRFLLEHKLTVDQILVVTFTEAATHELKDRIRKILSTAHEDFLRGRSDDNFLQQYLRIVPEPTKAGDRLAEAIRNFDQAAIFTIHGFCNKILQETAFENAGTFDVKLVTEQNELLKQIVQDFWRRNLYDQPALFIGHALTKISLRSLNDMIANKIGLRYLDIIPNLTPRDCKVEEEEFKASFDRLRAAWQTSRSAVAHILEENPALNRGLYRKHKMSGLIAAMDSYTASETANPVLFGGFEKFTVAALTSGTKRNCPPPEHPFFEACDEHLQKQAALERCFRARLIHLQRQLFDFAKQELIRRKQEKNIYFFDDLLLNLHAALDERQNLVKVIQNRYKAGLVDEFQDTDPVQYEIFNKIFSAEEHALFLIGDPKQAIYGFRGADIFAYIRAKKETSRQYTLSRNYRSTPRLVDAINTIFKRADKPFVFEEIPYHQTSVSPTTVHENLRLRDEETTPFRIWFVDSREYARNGKPVNKKRAREIIISAVASEIARLLQLGVAGEASLAGRAIEEKDIAVLVRTNLEAQQVQAALTELGVNSVLYSSANLFDSHEAEELERVLAAVIEPRKDRLLKAALATEVIGVRGDGLFEFAENEQGLEIWYEKFMAYHQLWQRHGFIRMFRELIQQESVLPRLMRYPDGERRVTNLLHLSEVLNQAATEQQLGRSGLLKWLSEQRAGSMAPVEAHQLRLESDEKAVKLVTMHMSKGLEYPVVFCPFTWSGSVLWRNDYLTFHAQTDESVLTVDLGSASFEKNKVLAEKEELAENLRLLYVAITRAKHRCYLVWGRFNEGPSSALAYLFHQPGMLAIDDLVTTLRKYVNEFDDAALLKDLQELANASHSAIEIEPMPTAKTSAVLSASEQTEALQCHEFTGTIDSGERISSYSSLVTQHPYSGELADYDALASPQRLSALRERVDGRPPFGDFLAFPAGARTGNFLHTLLQHLDFTTVENPTLRDEVRMRLAQFGFEESWVASVCNMLGNVLNARLQGVSGSLALSEIVVKNRLNELEFYFPLKRVSPATLRETFATLQSDQTADFAVKMQELSFVPFKGFMKGFIDLVFQHNERFFLIDWKSNYLGATKDDYQATALKEAMAGNFYILQYHLYVLALHQYLKQRLPHYDYETHFGGVFYIFVRGVDAARGAELGIFQDRPSAAMIERLATTLIACD